MPFEIILDENGHPVLKLSLENGSSLRLPFGDVPEGARDSLGETIEGEFNRVVREATLSERNRIQQGIKGLLGIRGTGRRE
ncbi:MAG: hypothetical protein GXX82_02745 [Syntrophorhabdus sp.]|jgi:hypothetical protein|nr:hypothetical protein [Syntrophorhabdus sp.]